jgi:hypothetical protein
VSIPKIYSLIYPQYNRHLYLPYIWWYIQQLYCGWYHVYPPWYNHRLYRNHIACSVCIQFITPRWTARHTIQMWLLLLPPWEVIIIVFYACMPIHENLTANWKDQTRVHSAPQPLKGATAGTTFGQQNQCAGWFVLAWWTGCKPNKQYDRGIITGYTVRYTTGISANYTGDISGIISSVYSQYSQ